MRVAVLKGGRSLEREVSLRSGANAEAALRRLGHEVLAIDADQHLVRTLRAERPDAAFIALHGKGGEDGTVQELLEILEIPYTGPGVLACERAMDKVVAKAHFAAAGIATPPGVRLPPGRLPGARRRRGDPRDPRAPGPAAGREAREPGLGARHLGGARDRRHRERPDERLARTTTGCCWSASWRAASSRSR